MRRNETFLGGREILRKTAIVVGAAALASLAFSEETYSRTVGSPLARAFRERAEVVGFSGALNDFADQTLPGQSYEQFVSVVPVALPISGGIASQEVGEA